MNSSSRIIQKRQSMINNERQLIINNEVSANLTLYGRINIGCNILELKLNDIFLFRKVLIINTKNEKIDGIVIENGYIYFENMYTYCESGSVIYILTEKYALSTIEIYKTNFNIILKRAIEFVRTIDISTINVRMSFDLDYDNTVGSTSLSQDFEESFVMILTSTLSIDRKRIIITEITKGSVIVNFKVIETDIVNELRPIEILEKIKYMFHPSTPNFNINNYPIFHKFNGISADIIQKPGQEYNVKYGGISNYYVKIYESILRSNNKPELLFDKLTVSIDTPLGV